VETQGAIVTLRDKRAIAAFATGPAELPFDAALIPSALYACEISGRFAAGLPDHLTITAGGQEARVRLDGRRIDH
jgi:hypothetical protein